MANVMVTQCPNCGARGAHEVVRTQAEKWYYGRLEELFSDHKDMMFRVRVRRCEDCDKSFETVEMGKRNLDRIVDEAAEGSQRAKKMEQAYSLSCADWGMAGQRAIARGLCLLFGEIWRPSISGEPLDLERVDTLSPEKLSEIVALAATSIGTLNEAEQKFITYRFGLQGMNNLFVAKEPEQQKFDVILRKLKHPTRSRWLVKACLLLEG